MHTLIIKYIFFFIRSRNLKERARSTNLILENLLYLFKLFIYKEIIQNVCLFATARNEQSL